MNKNGVLNKKILSMPFHFFKALKKMYVYQKTLFSKLSVNFET